MGQPQMVLTVPFTFSPASLAIGMYFSHIFQYASRLKPEFFRGATRVDTITKYTVGTPSLLFSFDGPLNGLFADGDEP